MELFAPGGKLAACMPGYEERDAQVRMAVSIGKALQNQEHLIVEAGTGVGKTLAYLVPILQQECQAVISTATRVLQHQLQEKDIPLVESALGCEPVVTLLKGRSNYLCKLRMEQLQVNPLFETTDEIPVWQLVKAWAPHTESGDFEELQDVTPGNPMLQRINADRNYCTGSRCPHFDSCYFYKLRRKAMQSDIVLVNHHLLCSDLSVRETRFGSILPDHPVLVVDEAHKLEDIATGQFGNILSPRMVAILLAQLPPDLKLTHSSRLKDQMTMDDLLPRGSFRRMGIRQAVRERLAVLQPLMSALRKDIEGLDEKTFELKENVLQRVAGFESFLSSLDDNELVGYMERDNGNLSFRTVPIDISPKIEQSLLDNFQSVVMTSATLAVSDKLDFFRGRVGLASARGEVLNSPFPYGDNTRLFIPERVADVNSPTFAESAMETLVPILERLHGRTFLLCTSIRNVNRFAELLRERTACTVLKQGDGSPAGLIGRFQLEENVVLVGSYSFWEGVDVKGPALSCVVIDRLPFPQPEEPVFKARSERMSNSFFGYSVPLAVLQFKQGLGRLVRSQSDTGLFVVLDKRLISKRYGQIFLNSFYKVPLLQSLAETEKYLAEL